MPIDYHLPLLPGEFYHIFNRGNNREYIFPEVGNIAYFLGKYAKYLAPVLDTYAYCLLPNHFHLLIRIKTEAEILALSPMFSGTVSPGSAPDMPSLRDLACLGLSLEKRDDGRETVEELVKRLLWMKSNGVDNAISVIISEQFRRFFMSYAKAVNKQTGRVGSLFQKHFKRLHVESAAYLKQVILYIHANPQLHGLCDDFRDWPDSSYHAFLSERPTKLARTAVLDFFGGKEAFIAAHDHYIDWRMAEKWMIED